MPANQDEPWDWSRPFDEDFVSSAAVREQPGAVRAAQAQRISSDHARATAWRAPQANLVPTGRQRRRRGAQLTLAVVAATLLALVGVLLTGRSQLPSPAFAGDGTPRVPVPADAQEQRVLPPVAAPEGEGGYELLFEQMGTPVLFDPCRPIHWVMRMSGAPPDGEALLREGFGTLSRATGLQFVYDGHTDEAYDEQRSLVQQDRYGNQYAPVLVTWSEPKESRDLAGDIAGFAGPMGGDPDGAGPRLLSGAVVLDSPQLAKMRTRPESLGVVLHELGHLVGLGHVDDPTDSMHARSGPATAYTVGALRGLAVVGNGPCFLQS